MKKITMKDVAKEADVSIATVSYVLNENKNETIPEETRRKVIAAAKKLNYVPNLAARSLVKRKSNLIGILIVKDYENRIPWRRSYYSEFIDLLVEKLNRLGYHVLISNIDKNNPELEIILSRELDGVFLIDVNKEIFYNISNKFEVPIIIIDSFINDEYFQKVIPDFEDAIYKSIETNIGTETILLLDKFNDDEINQRLINVFKERFSKIYIADNYDSLVKYLNENKDFSFVVLGELLCSIASKYIESRKLTAICTCDNSYLLDDEIKKVIVSSKTKSDIAVKIMMDYIDGKYYDEKIVLIKAD
ncbi:Catabolite control protein A [Caloramator mitchellensis]|uniref:Catabolite control protein A n=1 Tax=Caloramator mitchellensis TaxID=908809 RepID=A0A0R3K4A9_CALMK|nr:LacI family DNA-binding transcriptional regulator [Caloramator mitchellensis]KRQ87941.1 Catabolite control protein A [Caloramator mitchellensis]